MNEKAVVKYEDRSITITFDDVKRYICPKASDGEVVLFLKTCQSLGLNPFAKEIYLVKYTDEEPAAIIIAWDTYLKRAESHPEYEGHEAGLIVQTDYGPDFREGAFFEDESKIIGGWARVYRRGKRPYYYSVHISECRRYTKRGEPTRFWKEMPAAMVRKVALARALKEAFPSLYPGIVSEVEVGEGEIPEPFVKNGKPDWNKFWARLKELGVSREEAHAILGVESIKDYIAQGHTLGEAYEEIVRRRHEALEG